mmetsp:Transcript_559/g.1012  ORF Transcript_559/g.1012 Transcript_559/m.1012 type:complete len:202 (-) Transcript_559:583-1188(-)
MSQPRCEFGTVVRPYHTIARVEVNFEQIFVPDVILDALEGEGFSSAVVLRHGGTRVDGGYGGNIIFGIPQVGQFGHVSERCMALAVADDILRIFRHGQFVAAWYEQWITNVAILLDLVAERRECIGYTHNIPVERQRVRIVHSRSPHVLKVKFATLAHSLGKFSPYSLVDREFFGAHFLLTHNVHIHAVLRRSNRRLCNAR